MFVILIAIAPVLFSHAVGQGPSKYVPVTKYDPKRNADQDIRDAIEEAKRSKRRILLEVGGEWCGWCHRLDAFFEAHPDLTKLREKNFVTVKINFSEENPNKEVLSRYGPFPAILIFSCSTLTASWCGHKRLESGKRAKVMSRSDC